MGALFLPVPEEDALPAQLAPVAAVGSPMVANASPASDLVRQAILSLDRYVPGKPVEEVERELGLSEIIKLASNENPLGPSPKAVEAMRMALHSCSLYPDDAGYYLRQALSSILGVSPAQIILGNGGVEIIKMVCQTLINEGDEVILASPSFGIFREDVKQMGGVIQEIPLYPDFSYDLEGMRRAISPKTKMIILCSPNNPTGTIISKRALERFLQSLPPGLLILLDEAYRDFVEDPDYHDGIQYLQQARHLLVLRTFSKVYGLAGIRIGFGVGHEELIHYLTQVRVLFNVNALALTAALAALGDHDHYQASRNLVWTEKKFIYGELQSLGISFVPTEANFLAIQVGDDRAIFQELLHQGIIVRPGNGLHFPGYIRVTIGTRDQNERLLQCLTMTMKRRKTSPNLP